MPALIVLALAPAVAAAGEIACVRCTGPDQIYRCEVSGDAAPGASSVGLFCASRIASEHAHESCAAQRGVTDCAGLTVSYAYGEDVAPGVAAIRPPSAEPKNAGKNEPETLGEFTKETVQGSANAVKKAGENIGSAANKAGQATADAVKGAGAAISNATKKTLKCLGSALNDC